MCNVHQMQLYLQVGVLSLMLVSFVNVSVQCSSAKHITFKYKTVEYPLFKVLCVFTFQCCITYRCYWHKEYALWFLWARSAITNVTMFAACPVKCSTTQTKDMASKIKERALSDIAFMHCIRINKRIFIRQTWTMVTLLHWLLNELTLAKLLAPRRS